MLYAPVTGHPQLSDRYTKLGSDEARAAQQEVAEALLGLRGPAYTDEGTLALLQLALVHQINFQLQQGVEPDTVRSESKSHPGMMTVFRDRYVSPRAATLAAEATNAKYPGFRPPPWGV